MENEFYMYLAYKSKTVKFKVLNPNDSLGLLMEKVKKLQMFDMPNVDPSGAPLNYWFGKTDANGKNILLKPRIGKTEMYLHDYGVKNGDTLAIIPEPIAG